MHKMVVALGGNAISDPATPGTIADQFAQSRATSVVLANLIDAGHQLLITHGNGPQVGNILRRVELAAGEVYPIDLGLCVADSQAGMGYMICQCLANELASRGRKMHPTTIVTTVRVDADDPAFSDPTKPIGIYYTKEQADRHTTNDGWQMKEIAGRGWRRMVPSPRPLEILQLDAIRSLFDAGQVVVAAGGGGIPVIHVADRGFEGVEAVIDKDLTSAMLAVELEADTLAIITGEDAVYRDFGTPGKVKLDVLVVADARKMFQAGQFPAGSMGPKIQAAINFLTSAASADVQVLITTFNELEAALDGRAGTRIRP